MTAKASRGRRQRPDADGRSDGRHDSPAPVSGDWAAPPPARTTRPPRLLLTLLGDYWWGRTEQLPSAALVALLGEFGVGDAAARVALSRLVDRGLLDRSKRGRRTFLGLSERAAGLLDDGARRLSAFGNGDRDWDGMWSVVAFSIPERDRRIRYTLRDRLRWLGFAPLYDGLWVSPRQRLEEAVEELAGLSITTATAFRARAIEGTPERGAPQRAWDLAALHGHYERFIAELEPLLARLARGDVTPEQALIARTRAMDSWRAFPQLDPELPTGLLPADWPQHRARELFIDAYDGLGPIAERRVQQIIARYAPEIAALATHHTFGAMVRERRARRVSA
jgi:phenylacetic acid degradation operon negative regulatory protein